METVKVLIVDDHEVIHNGLKDILGQNSKYQIVGNAFDGKDGIEKALLLKPDIIFMDLSIPKLNGIEATKEIHNQLSSIKIIALTQHEENEYVIQFIKAGGNGYLLKNSKKEFFFDAIETVLDNKRYISKDISEKLMNATLANNTEDKANKSELLTRREIEIIRKIADDKTNQAIADELNISLRTVETHRRNLMQKLKVKSVVAMIKYASSNKLIDF